MAQDAIIINNRAIWPYPHSMEYFDGYLYIAVRDEGLQCATVWRIRDVDYTDVKEIQALYTSSSGLSDMIQISNDDGDFLYVSSHHNRLIKINITRPALDVPPLAEVEMFNLPAGSYDCLCADDEYIYLGTINGKVVKVEIADPTNIVQIYDGSGSGLNFHAMVMDEDYLYASEVAGGYLIKIDKVTGTQIAYATTGKCTDDLAQDNDYVFMAREFTTAGIVRVRKSDLDVTVVTPGGMGFSYGVFNIDGKILFLNHSSIYEFDADLNLIETWNFTLPDGYDGLNELVYDGERYWFATCWGTNGVTNRGLIKFVFETTTYEEGCSEGVCDGTLGQLINVKMGHIYPFADAKLQLIINNSYVDVVNAKVSLRTINQGHSLFSAMVDNIDEKFIGVFDARDKVQIMYRKNGIYHEIFRGVLDSGKHILDQNEKWNFSDRIRLGGRDMSYLLSNFKLNFLWPYHQQVLNALYYAFQWTGCPITVDNYVSPEIDGKTSIDKYLLDLVNDFFEIANMEGYVDKNSALKYSYVDTPSATPLIFNRSNVLSATPVDFDGIEIKNSIEVLGDLKLEEPEIPDIWTDWGSEKYWEKIVGTDLFINTGGIKGMCVKCTTILDTDGFYRAYARLKLPETIHAGYHGQYKTFEFYFYVPIDLWPDQDMFRIYMMGTYGGYYTDVYLPNWIWPWSTHWYLFKEDIGVEKTATPDNPLGKWHPFGGNPDWLNITHVDFTGVWASNGVDDCLILDAMKFSPKRTHYIERNELSISNYGKHEHLVMTDFVTNAECKRGAESLSKKMSSPVKVLQIITPLDSLIVDDVWYGDRVGHTVEVDLSPTAIGTYRIQDVTIDIAPYENLKDGHDAVATINLVKAEDEFHPDMYAATARPRVTSLLKRYSLKGTDTI